MSDIVKIEFDFSGNLIEGLGEAEKGSKKLNTSLSDVLDALERFGNVALHVNSISDLIGGIASKVRGSITECMDAYKKQAEAETKLEGFIDRIQIFGKVLVSMRHPSCSSSTFYACGVRGVSADA